MSEYFENEARGGSRVKSLPRFAATGLAAQTSNWLFVQLRQILSWIQLTCLIRLLRLHTLLRHLQPLHLSIDGLMRQRDKHMLRQRNGMYMMRQRLRHLLRQELSSDRESPDTRPDLVTQPLAAAAQWSQHSPTLTQ